jgi:hypothetical protein
MTIHEFFAFTPFIAAAIVVLTFWVEHLGHLKKDDFWLTVDLKGKTFARLVKSNPRRLDISIKGARYGLYAVDRWAVDKYDTMVPLKPAGLSLKAAFSLGRPPQFISVDFGGFPYHGMLIGRGSDPKVSFGRIAVGRAK